MACLSKKPKQEPSMAFTQQIPSLRSHHELLQSQLAQNECSIMSEGPSRRESVEVEQKAEEKALPVQ